MRIVDIQSPADFPHLPLRYAVRRPGKWSYTVSSLKTQACFQLCRGSYSEQNCFWIRRAFHEGHIYITRKRFAGHRMTAVIWYLASPKELTFSIWPFHRWRDHPEYPFNDEYWKRGGSGQPASAVRLCWETQPLVLCLYVRLFNSALKTWHLFLFVLSVSSCYWWLNLFNSLNFWFWLSRL